jgi:hypothetical protein
MNSPPGLPMPELTAFDVVTHLISALVYIAVGAAGLAQAPRDGRTRVFAALGVTHAVGFLIPAAAWFLGEKDPLAFNRVPLAVMLSALSVGALLMFQFSQVFPRRRPWIRESGMQLPIAYALTPVAVFLLVRWWPASEGSATPAFGLTFVVFGFPLMVLLGLVLPIASIVSLVRSLREASIHARSKAAGTSDPFQPVNRDASVNTASARVPLSGILISQLGGALLSIIVLAPLSALAPESFAVVVVALTVWLFGLVMPLAYAAGIWKYGVLEIPDASPEMQAD